MFEREFISFLFSYQWKWDSNPPEIKSVVARTNERLIDRPELKKTFQTLSFGALLKSSNYKMSNKSKKKSTLTVTFLEEFDWMNCNRNSHFGQITANLNLK